MAVVVSRKLYTAACVKGEKRARKMTTPNRKYKKNWGTTEGSYKNANTITYHRTPLPRREKEGFSFKIKIDFPPIFL